MKERLSRLGGGFTEEFNVTVALVRAFGRPIAQIAGFLYAAEFIPTKCLRRHPQSLRAGPCWFL
jgi:hypothetical protein